VLARGNRLAVSKVRQTAAGRGRARLREALTLVFPLAREGKTMAKTVGDFIVERLHQWASAAYTATPETA
jgi:hypothetical protein